MNILRQTNIYGNRANERALHAKLLENVKKQKANLEDRTHTGKMYADSQSQKEDSIEISPEGRLAAGQARDALEPADSGVDGADHPGISEGQYPDMACDKPTEGSAFDKAEDTALSGEQDEVGNSEKQGGKVAVNEGKRRRQIAAAQSRGQVQQVLALLQKDLSDCKAGLEKGWCDESEIAKVEALIAMAKERMSQVPQESRENRQGGLDAFAMASLM